MCVGGNCVFVSDVLISFWATYSWFCLFRIKSLVLDAKKIVGRRLEKHMPKQKYYDQHRNDLSAFNHQSLFGFGFVDKSFDSGKQIIVK